MSTLRRLFSFSMKIHFDLLGRLNEPTDQNVVMVIASHLIHEEIREVQLDCGPLPRAPHGHQCTRCIPPSFGLWASLFLWFFPHLHYRVSSSSWVRYSGSDSYSRSHPLQLYVGQFSSSNNHRTMPYSRNDSFPDSALRRESESTGKKTTRSAERVCVTTILLHQVERIAVIKQKGAVPVKNYPFGLANAASELDKLEVICKRKVGVYSEHAWLKSKWTACPRGRSTWSGCVARCDPPHGANSQYLTNAHTSGTITKKARQIIPIK